jgi:hypothetical protein
VVRTAARPKLGRPLLEPAAAGEVTELLLADAPRLRATAAWFVHLKRQRVQSARGTRTGSVWPSSEPVTRTRALARRLVIESGTFCRRVRSAGRVAEGVELPLYPGGGVVAFLLEVKTSGFLPCLARLGRLAESGVGLAEVVEGVRFVVDGA